MQVGVECIGKIDNLCICENILLAVKSLSKIKNDFILDISHLDIIDKITKELNISETGKKHIIKAFGEKNTQYMDEILSEENLPKKSGEFIKSLIHTYGIPKDVILKLEESEFSSVIKDEIDLLKSISDTLIKNGFEKNARIDFSVINNMKYYNGIAFKGFINGVPEGVLSGGQYNKLMNKMGKKSKAIGFAVYLDVLDRI